MATVAIVLHTELMEERCFAELKENLWISWIKLVTVTILVIGVLRWNSDRKNAITKKKGK